MQVPLASHSLLFALICALLEPNMAFTTSGRMAPGGASAPSRIAACRPSSSIQLTAQDDSFHLRHLERTLLLQRQSVSDNGLDLSMAGVGWEAGLALADLITNPVGTLSWRGKTVVELGSGTGLCAIAAALSGARVIATDMAPESLRLAQINLQRYSTSYAHPARVMELGWGRPIPAELSSPDVVMAADVVYARSETRGLQATIEELCPVGGNAVVVIAQRWRVPKDEKPFYKGLEASGFHRTEVPNSLLPAEFQTRSLSMECMHPVSIMCFSR